MATVRLTWDPSTDNAGGSGVAGYRITRAGTDLTVVGASTTSYDDTTAPDGASLTYQVFARDVAGNESTAASVSVTTPAVDSTPPTAPASLTLVEGHSSLDASWPAGTDDIAVDHYILTVNGSEVLSVPAVDPRSVTIGGLDPLTTYTVGVVTVDTSGNRSTARTATARTLSDAATIYVSAAGSDTGLGTIASPFLTAGYASKHRLAGQTVLFRHGDTFGQLAPKTLVSYGVYNTPVGVTPAATLQATSAAAILLDACSDVAVDGLSPRSLVSGDAVASVVGSAVQRFTLRNAAVYSAAGRGVRARNDADAGWKIGPGVTVETPAGVPVELAGADHEVGAGDEDDLRDNLIVIDGGGATAIDASLSRRCFIHDVDVHAGYSTDSAFYSGRDTTIENVKVDATALNVLRVASLLVGLAGHTTLRRSTVKNLAAGKYLLDRDPAGPNPGGIGTVPLEHVTVGKATVAITGNAIIADTHEAGNTGGNADVYLVSLAVVGTGTPRLRLDPAAPGFTLYEDYNLWETEPLVETYGALSNQDYDTWRLANHQGLHSTVEPAQLDATYYPLVGSPARDSGTQNVGSLGFVPFLGLAPDRGDREAVPAAPPTPAAPVCSDADEGSITVAWSFVPTAEDYSLYVDDVEVWRTAHLSARITGFVPETPHTFRVVAHSAYGDSALGPAVTCTTDPGPAPITGDQPLPSGALPFLELIGEDGTPLEVGNAARVTSYVRRGLARRARVNAAPGCLCGVLDRETGTTTSPSVDPAPWYDPLRPESADFLGFYPYDIKGLRRGVGEREIMQRAGGGAAFGPQILRERTIDVKGRLVAASSIGMDYGVQWLKGVLTQSNCSPCGLAALRVRTACPPEDGSRDDVGEALLYDVAVTEWDDEPDGGCGIEDWGFRLVAGKGEIYRAPKDCLPPTIINAPAGACVPFDEWLCGTSEAYRQACCRIEAPPLFGVNAAIVTIDATHGDVIAPITISLYADQPGFESCPPAIEIDPVARLTIPELAAGSKLIVDSARRQLVYVDPDGVAHDGTPYVELEQGRGVPWIEADRCQVGACVCVGTLRRCGASATVEITTQLRER
jgi:hypothetical protein